MSPVAVGEGARLTDSARTEAFSDGVVAIAVTLLVLDLKPPHVGDFVHDLPADWTAYLAYLTAFLTISSIWVSHHSAFSRIRYVDPAVLVLNLFLLLGVSLVPWPTALLSTAIRGGHRSDESAAVVVYALVSVLVSVGWFVLARTLIRRPHLLEQPSDAAWLRTNSHRSLATGLVTAAAGVVGLVAPLVAVVVFLVVPGLFLVSVLVERDDAVGG